MVPTRVQFWRFSLPRNRLGGWPVGGEGMEPEDAVRSVSHSLAFLAAFGKRQAKLGGSRPMKRTDHGNGSKAMEPTLKRWGAIPGAEAGEGKHASRSRLQTRISLVTHSGSGQPFQEGEARIGGEDSISTRRTPRGGRRQRAWKEPSGTWETRPGAEAKSRGQRPQGSHNL